MPPTSLITLPIRSTWFLWKLSTRIKLAVRFSDYSETIRDFACSIQEQLAAFTLVSGERHKELRIALEAAESNQISKGDLQKSIKALDTLIDTYQVRACDTALKSFSRYLSFRCSAAESKPRVCVKLVRDAEVFTFLRCDGATDAQTKTPISTIRSSNTGFDVVLASGQAYLENDIPTKARNGDYKNPRLRGQPAKLLKSGWFKRMCRYFSGKPDNEWMACWEALQGATSTQARDCYKSTMIVPIALSKTQVVGDFEALYGAKLPKDDSRFTFGFLCADSLTTGFFQTVDVDHGYVFADLLSLFLIRANALRNYSETYQKAKGLAIAS